MSARIMQAAEHVVRAMLGQDGTASAIVGALADANLLQLDERPGEIAPQSEVIELRSQLTIAVDDHRSYAAAVEDDLVELAALRLMGRRMQERTAAAVAETARLRGVLRDITALCTPGRCPGDARLCPAEVARQALSVGVPAESGRAG